MDDSRLKPPCYREDAADVVKTLRAAGHAAYFAGGCVRDLLLGLEPKDYDVATDAVPQKVRSLFKNTQAVGAAFGVILVRTGRSVIEVATFRSDGKYLDGRRPSEVRFTTAEEDAKRRDFTINGLFLDPMTHDVIDYVGGRDDLANRILRAIGIADERFEEDHLRLLRAIRFAARFDLKIDAATTEAMRRHSAQLVRISPERVAEELRLMLTPPWRNKAIELLNDFGLLGVVLRFYREPLLTDLHAFRQIAAGRTISFGLALAGVVTAVFGSLGKAAMRSAASALRQALRLSNEEIDAFIYTMEGFQLLASPLDLAGKKRFLARSTAAESRELFKAIHGDAPTIEVELRKLEQTDFAPPPLVTGDDLTAAGMKPGPVFKRVLDAVYDAQLEGKVFTKEEAMRLAEEVGLRPDR